MTTEFSYKTLKGKKFKFSMIDGKSMTGILITEKRYEFVLDVSGKEVILFKHAVKYLREVDE